MRAATAATLLSVMLGFFGSTSAGAAVLSVEAGQDVTPSVTYFLEDPPFPDTARGPLRSSLTPAEAAVREFQPLERELLNFGYTDQRAWLRFSVLNPEPVAVERYLLTGQRYMRPLVLFEKVDGEWVERFYNDQFQSFDKRPVALPDLAIPLRFEPGESRSFMIFVGAGGALSLNLALEAPEVVERENFRALVTVAFVCGIILALVIINLFHFVAVGRPANLVYALMETAIGLYLLHMEGFAFQYLWPNAVGLNMIGTTLLGHSANLLASLFVILYLELHKLHRRLMIIPAAFALVAGIGVLLAPFAPARLSNEIGTVMTSVGPLIYLVFGVYVYLRGNKSALFFALGWTILGLGNFLFGATVIGWLDLPLVSIEWLRLGVLGEAILLSWGLSDQVRRLNEEHRNTQQQLVQNLEIRLAEARERIALEEQNAERALQLAEMDRKLVTTSHDVGQPIYALRLSLMGLADKIQDATMLQNLNQTLDDMEALLHDSLDREIRVDTKLPRTYGELFNSIARSFSAEADDRGIELKVVDSSVELSGVEIVSLRRLVQNLVANALKHSGASRILIGLRRHATQVHVIDNGTGLSREGQRKATSGSGLGLSIVREICDKHGWLLGINSMEDRGVQFRIGIRP